MPRTNIKKRTKAVAQPANSPQLLKGDASAKVDPEVHAFGNGFDCDTEARRHATPQGRARLEIVVDASEALLAWGGQIHRANGASEFEIVMKSKNDDCDNSGCVLASAFFPDSGRHQLRLDAKMFTQVRQEQVETLIHEIGR